MFLENFSPNCGANVATAIAEILSDGLTAAQINIFANFIIAIGGTMAYIASQKEFNEDAAKENDPPKSGIVKWELVE